MILIFGKEDIHSSSGKTHLILGCKGASPFALAWGYNKWGLNENRGFVTV